MSAISPIIPWTPLFTFTPNTSTRNGVNSTFLSPDKVPDAKKYKLYRYAQTFATLPLEYCFKYVMSNLKYAQLLVLYIPFGVLLDLYTNHGYLREYLTQAWIDEILEHHQVLHISSLHANIENPDTPLKANIFNISLSASITGNGGAERIISKRARIREGNIPEFIADNFYLGAAIVSDIMYSISSSSESRFGSSGNEREENEYVLYPKRAIRLRGVKILSKNYVLAYLPIHFNHPNRDTKFVIYRKIVDIAFVLNYEHVCGEVIYSSSSISVYVTPFGYQELALGMFNSDCRSDEDITNKKFILDISPLSTPQVSNALETNCGGGKERKSVIKNVIDYFTKKCYMCNCKYSPKFTFSYYNKLCFQCGIFNYGQQLKTVVLPDKVVRVFVTGCRFGVGYAVAIKLLRRGAFVVGATRYPAAALYNFSQEADFQTWSHRLVICGCDFVIKQSLDQTIAIVTTYKPNIVINTVCRTVQHSIQYYQEVSVVEGRLRHKYAIGDDQIYIEAGAMPVLSANEVPNLNSIKNIKEHVFNTSNITLEDIPSNEMVEMGIINQLAPSLILQSILPELRKSLPAFVIQVSEKNKNIHANMSSAAMDTLIRDLIEQNDGVLKYIVESSERKGTLSMYDSAQRVIDPIIEYYRGTSLRQGLYRNYKYVSS